MATQIIDTKAALAELSDLIENFVVPENYRKWLDQQAAFHTYSWRNTLLIMSQCPEATTVAGFQTWLKKQGRVVRKGEKSIKILAPIPYEDKDEAGKIKSGIFFKAVSVFDVSQTDPLPDAKHVFIPEGPIVLDEGQSVSLYERGVDWMTKETVSVQSDDDKGHRTADGWYSPSRKEIFVRPANSLKKLETFIHEIAHHLQVNLPEKQDYGYAGNEVVVESAAYVVCKHFGLDVTVFAVPYVRSWLTSDKKAFERGLSTISKLSEKIIVELSSRLQEEAAAIA